MITRNAQPATSNPVIIAVTASAFDEDRIAIMASGCDDFLSKPFSESDLFDMMTKHLGVRFVYGESLVTDIPKEDDGDKNILTPERLNALPEELLDALKTSAKRTDPKRSKMVVDQIREHDEPLAEALHGLVKTYRFDIMLKLLEKD